MSHELNQLRKFVSPEIIFGAGSRHNVGNYAKTFGARKVLIVSDPGVVAAGWAGDVEASLQAQGIAYCLYTKVSPNPRVEEVMEGAELYRSEGCNVIVAVGGGSPMDCAKGIGIVVAHGRSILEFEGVDTIRVPSPPLILIPTTAGTSADVSQFVIISNQQERMKFSIVSKAVVPDVSLIDPETTLSMDPFLSACTGIDAMVHAIEAYTSKIKKNPLSDLLAREALRLLAANLHEAVYNGHNREARQAMLLGALLAGQAFANAPCAAVHALAYPLGGHFHIPHGLSNALVLPHVLRFNAPAAAPLYAELAPLLLGERCKGEGTGQRCADFIHELAQLNERCGLPSRLRDAGVPEAMLPTLARDAMLQQRLLVNNPREVSEADALAIYQAAY